MKINELKRVVNVDKFSKYANILKDTNFNDEKQIDSILTELSKKTPSREVLMKTRLGFILKELSTRESLSKKTRDNALNLRTKWKDFHKRLLLAPKFDVKCDKPTSENRQKVRQAFSNAFSRGNSKNSNDQNSVLFDPNSEEHMGLINDLEFSVFQHCDKLVNTKYFKTARQLIQQFQKPNNPLRDQFLRFELKTDDLIKKYLTQSSPAVSQACSSTSSNFSFDLEDLLE